MRSGNFFSPNSWVLSKPNNSSHIPNFHEPWTIKQTMDKHNWCSYILSPILASYIFFANQISNDTIQVVPATKNCLGTKMKQKKNHNIDQFILLVSMKLNLKKKVRYELKWVCTYEIGSCSAPRLYLGRQLKRVPTIDRPGGAAVYPPNIGSDHHLRATSGKGSGHETPPSVVI